MINKTINGYTIKYQIGTGGMADVYFGENTLGLPAAIKVLKKEYSQHPQVKDRFINEAKIMKTLDHPYIRKVMDLGEIDGNPCIIMEYLEGQTFKELLQSSNKISDSRLIKYFDQCVDALQYTHSQKVTHRDIKPSNIFISKKDEVKLLDFGIAKSEMGLSHTITGQTLGTIIYMSPEQVVDPKRVTSQTDIYSLGVTFYQALIGKPPYDAKTGSEFTIQQKIVYENLDLTIIPTHWRSKLEACLHKTAEDRSMSMHKTKDYTIFDPPLSTPKQPTPSISKWFVYIFIVGIVLALAVGLYFAKQETPEWKLQKRIISEIRSNMVKVEGGSFYDGLHRRAGTRL
jgi:serine/threonine protein kinase